MIEPGDWDPLPDEQLALHPGEVSEPEPVPVSVAAVAAAPTAAPPPAPAEPAQAVDPRAEQLLQQLQARLKKAPPGKSLIAVAEQREQKQRRRLQAVHAPQLAGLRPLQAPPPGSQPLAVEFAPGRDAREDEAWFRSLPKAEQERLRDVWTHKRVQGTGMDAVLRRNRNRRTTAAVVIFAALVVLGTGVWWYATLGGGVVCGIVWRHTRPCRYRDPLIAFACLLGTMLIAWAAAGGDPPAGWFMDAVILVGMASLIGFDGEIRRNGGFDAR